MKLNFTFGTGSDTYQLSVDGPELKISADCISSEEDLSLVLKGTKGVVVVVRENSAGKINDAPGGEPGMQMFRDGLLVIKGHYKDGLYHDSPKGGAAIQEFDAKGQVVRVEYYQNGKKLYTRPKTGFLKPPSF